MDSTAGSSSATEHVHGGEPVDYRVVTGADRADAVNQLAGLMAATHAELLRLVIAVVRGSDWVDDGATDPAAWLVAMCGLTRDHAREWVRVALALEELPHLRGAFATGRLSWDQVRPATLFATPDTDAAVLAEIDGLSARQVGHLARLRRPITRPEADDANRNQSLTFRPDHARGCTRVTGRMPNDVAAAVAAALNRRAEALGPDAATGKWDPLPRRRAQALHDLATADLAAAAKPDSTCVVIHADVEVVDGTILGNGTVGGSTISRDGILRALCDCRIEAHLHGPGGATVGIARAGRQPPPWLRRAIVHRDGTCRFPGCDRAIRQIHHILHWTLLGPTNADNLVGLCWSHHTLVHEGGWTIWGDPDGELTFVDRYRARRWTSRRDPVRPSTTARMLATAGPSG